MNQIRSETWLKNLFPEKNPEKVYIQPLRTSNKIRTDDHGVPPCVRAEKKPVGQKQASDVDSGGGWRAADTAQRLRRAAGTNSEKNYFVM